MKPQGHLSLPKEVGKAFAEAQLASLDRQPATATFGATACSGFKEVGHPGRIFQGGPDARAVLRLTLAQTIVTGVDGKGERSRA
jgi:hypothetical protein